MIGLKDVRNGTWRLKRRLLKTDNIVTFDGFKMMLDERSYMDLSLFRQYLEDSTYEVEISKYIRSSLRPGNTFVDVGANSGYYSLLTSSIVGEDGLILAFEPYSNSFNRLISNLKLNNFNNVLTFKMALSSYDGKAYLKISSSSDGLNSLKDIPLIEENIEVDVGKLDTIFTFKRDVDMIKVDAEGSEIDVFKGASNILAKNRDIKIIYEVNRSFIGSQELVDNLKELGFISFTVKGGKISKQISKVEEIPAGISNLVALRK